MKLFIVIVTFNGGETLEKLIERLLMEKEGIGGLGKFDTNIIIAENGDTELRVTNHESRITVIKNKKNLGFAKGANIGIKYALENNADRILLLNQDVFIEKGFIQTLMNNPADIVSPVIKFKRGNNWIFDYGGKMNWWIGRTYHLENVHLGGAMASLRSACHHPRWSNPDYVSGCCMLVKREVFEKVGFFDERFFLYFEDADFCLRAKREGFTIEVEPKSIITHELIEGKKRPFFKKYHLLRSNFIFINKYLGIKKIIGYFYLIMLAIKIVIDSFFHLGGVEVVASPPSEVS